MKAMEIGAFDAKNKLSQLLEQAERGQRIYITRRGKRVAMLSRAVDGETDGSPVSNEELIARLRAVRKSAKKGRETLKELIEEGRRR